MEHLYIGWRRYLDSQGKPVYHRVSGDWRCIVREEAGEWIAQIMGPPYCYPDYGMRQSRQKDGEAARHWADSEVNHMRAARRRPPPPSWMN